MIIEAIWAQSKNGIIGKANRLPWARQDEDIRFFREKIQGKTLIVGRKTFESLPGSIKYGDKASTIIILTNSLTEPASDNLHLAHSVEEALEIWKKLGKTGIVAGGKQVYDLMMPHTSLAYVSDIDVNVDGDTEAPVIGEHLYRTVNFGLSKYVRVSIYYDHGVLTEKWANERP